MSLVRPGTIGEALRSAELSDRRILAPGVEVRLRDVVAGSSLKVDRDRLAGRSVLVATTDQMTAALALIELDGLARRIVISPPDLRPEHLPSVIADADIDTIVSDRDPVEYAGLDVSLIARCGLPLEPCRGPAAQEHATEWVLLTSGTTGAPKMVVHTLAGLTGAIDTTSRSGQPTVWATFYDIRRYGGLQIFFRAMLGNSSLVLSQAGENTVDHLHRLAAAGVTHISGTPSHWRKTLMCATASAIAPDYIRLSGEIADQAILNALHEAYPKASIGHAYASTEAGVGFAVDDGLEGFPASFLDNPASGVEMKVVDGCLAIRSTRAASRYLGRNAEHLAADDGFIDTGDMVERRGDRYYFVGRRGGIINVGGLKVHPEEVEAVINRHHDVRMSLVKARKSPIMGSIVVADVVLNDDASTLADGTEDNLKDEILHLCRDALPQHKVPATVRFVPALDVTAAGKLARNHA